MSLPVRLITLALCTLTAAQVQTYVPQEEVINSGRPTFYDLTPPIAGKIALEEHGGNSLFSGTFTTPFVNYTNEVDFVSVQVTENRNREPN